MARRTPVTSPSTRRWLASLGVLLAGLVATGIVTAALVASQHANSAAAADRAGLVAARQLEVLALPSAQIAEALRSYVVAENGDLDYAATQAFMNRLLERSSLVRSIALAPDNVIEYIAPLAGNEAALGLDLESIPEQWEPIKPLIANAKPGLIGPFPLVQGGIGLAYRTPIFLGDGTYWGLSSAVIDGDAFFAAALANTGIDITSTGLRSAVTGEALWGEQAAFQGDFGDFDVNPPGATWQLAVPTDDITHTSAIVVSTLGAILSALLALLTFAAIGARQRRDEATDRLNDLAALTPGMLFQYRINADGTTTMPYVSDRLAETFGLDSEEIARDAEDLWSLVDESDRDSAAAGMAEAVAADRLWQHRMRLRKADGELHWYQARATPEVLRSGDIVLHGYLADVEADVTAEERMRIHASVYAATHNGVIIMSESGHILDVNEAFTQMTGYTADEVLGHHLRFLGSNLTPDAVYRDIRSALARDNFWRGEFTMRHADGAPADHALAVLTVRDDTEQSSHIIVVMSPISELRDDLVTGLPGRLMFGARLDLLLDRAGHSQEGVALAIVGLDRFADINVAFGHRIGDLVLREVAQRIESACPQAEALARIGGDEFAVVLTGPTDADELRPAIERLSDVFAAPIDLTSGLAHLSASVGIALFPKDGISGPDLMNAATHAMRAAKRDGGGRYRFYTPEMREWAERRARLNEALNSALDQGHLTIKFQPIIDLRTGRIVKAEALARLHDPDLGHIGPDQFIPLAESTGRIGEIGDIAFASAMSMARDARVWQPDFSVGVNLSPTELRSGPAAHEGRLQILQDLGLPGSALTVEITEEAALESNEDTLQTLAAYHDAGVSVAVDDFGTGYSSLSYLQQLRIDLLKIDRSFVASLAQGNESHTLVLVIIEMARTLGLRTIAEGIETEEQAALLAAAGCSFGQGWLYGAAMEADELLDLLRRQAASAENPPAQ